MKKFFTRFFVVLGVIFFIQIVFVLYQYFTAPEEDAPSVLDRAVDIIPTTSPGPDKEEGVDKNPILNDSQERVLEAVGIDPAEVPTGITPEQEACFEEIIGTERVVEIKAGDAPTALEVLRGRVCL